MPSWKPKSTKSMRLIPGETVEYVKGVISRFHYGEISRKRAAEILRRDENFVRNWSTFFFGSRKHGGRREHGYRSITDGTRSVRLLPKTFKGKSPKVILNAFRRLDSGRSTIKEEAQRLSAPAYLVRFVYSKWKASAQVSNNQRHEFSQAHRHEFSQAHRRTTNNRRKETRE